MLTYTNLKSKTRKLLRVAPNANTALPGSVLVACEMSKQAFKAVSLALAYRRRLTQ